MPDLPEIADYERDYNALMGRLLVSYNRVEGSLRALLAEIARGPKRTTATAAIATIMTVELGAVGIAQALKSIATSILRKEHKEHVLHAVELFDRLRAYRNYYVHGVSHIISTTEGIVGFVHIDSAKGHLKEHKDFIFDAQITDLIAKCATALAYIQSFRIRYQFDIGDCPSDWPEPYMPDKPPLPDTLSKPAKSWTEYFPPP